MSKHKIGVHVSAQQRNGYGDAAPHLVSVCTFDPGAFDEIPDNAIKIFRTHAVANHKDVAGDFDNLRDDQLAPAAIWWWTKYLEPIYRKIRDQYGDNVYFQPTNEINNPRILLYLDGMIEAAGRDGYKLALLGDAGDSPTMDTREGFGWEEHWLPWLKKHDGKGHIYVRHAYSGVTDEDSHYLTNEDGTPTDNNTGRPFVEARMMRDAGIKMPMVITELGWRAGWEKLPSGWLADILRYNKLMMQHDNIVGSCLWNAGQWETAPNILAGKPLKELGNQLKKMEPVFYDPAKVIEVNTNPAPVPVSKPVTSSKPPQTPTPTHDPNTQVIKGDYVFVERFRHIEKEQWYDWKLPNGDKSNMQVPNEFEVNNITGDNPFSDGKSWNRFGLAEASHLTASHNLPKQDEGLYTEFKSAVYPDHGVAYKLFSNDPFNATYTTEIEVKAGKQYRVEARFFADFAHYKDPKRGKYSKVIDRMDLRHGLVRFWADGHESAHQEIEYMERNVIGSDFTPRKSGKIKVHFQFISTYAMAPSDGVAGYFITEMGVCEVEYKQVNHPQPPHVPPSTPIVKPDPVTPEPIVDDEPWRKEFSYQATAYLLPQDANMFVEPWSSIRNRMIKRKSTFTFSHHDFCSSLYLSTNKKSKGVIYGSRPEALKLAGQMGIKVETIERPDKNKPPAPKPAPPPAVVADVEKEEPENPFHDLKLGQPLSNRWVFTNHFNAKRGYGNKLHEGVDLDDNTTRGNSRASVLALNDGVVVATYRKSTGYGVHVVVTHKHKGEYPYTVTHGHLEQIYVRKGQHVKRGDRLGEIGNTGNSSGEHLHLTLQLHGYGLHGYVRTDVVNPVPFLPDPRQFGRPVQQPVQQPVRDEPKPPTRGMDLLPYLKGDGRMYEFLTKNSDGSQNQERNQTQVEGKKFYQTKNQHWEEFWIQDDKIYRGVDTSPGGGNYYQMTTNGRSGAPWIPRYWMPGQRFTRTAQVQKFRLSGGAVDPSPQTVTDTMIFVARHKKWAGYNGIILEDVIELKWDKGESYFYAKNFGLVGWGRSHADPLTPQGGRIAEIHAKGARPDNVRERIG